MKIKIAILEQDKNYLQRLISAFEIKYEDKVEMYSFTDEKLALEAVRSNKINILLVSDDFVVNRNAIPERCGFAYLVNTPDAEVESGAKAICKFQKIDLIYKEIVSLYSENALDQVKNYDEGSARILAFTSPAGGIGASSMAVACAKYFAKCGKKTLYFSTEELGVSDLFFMGEGQFTFDDVIYAVKSKKTNMTLKFESTVKQDISGVYFFSAGSKALDVIDLSEDEVRQLIVDLKMSGIFDVIIWDMDFRFKSLQSDLMQLVSDIIIVSDGSETGNLKFKRMYESVEVLEKQGKIDISAKMWVLYNKFSNKTGKGVSIGEIKELGGAPRYDHASVNQIIEQLLKLNIFEKLLV